MSSPLRAVPAGSPKRRRRSPKTVQQAADSGTRRDLLVAMRERIAGAVSDLDTRPADLASLTRRLMEIAKEIDAIDSSDSNNVVTRAAATPDQSWDASAI